MKLQRTTVPIKLSPFRVPRGGQAEPLCHVTAPSTRPKGICHFLGGAFVGAAPQLSYSLFVDLIASSGYTVIQNSYPFSFRHRDLAISLRSTFEECLAELRRDGQGLLVPEDVPVHGVGHSNGSLMHLLIGSLHYNPVASNVIISFNNKEVADAIPIPGFIESSAPLLRQGRQRGLALTPEQVRSQWEAAIKSAPVSPIFNPLMQGMGPVLSQISSAFTEIEEGTIDFDPTPAESRQLIRDRYNVRSTLLLRYADDTIDETPDIAGILKGRPDLIVTDQVLPGSHVTPCGVDIPWQVGPVFAPWDAVVMAGKAVQQQDLRRTATTVIEWMNSNV